MTHVANDPDLTYLMEAPVNQPATTVRRPDPRHRPEAVPEIAALRLSPGDAGQIVNISASGLLMQSHTRYAPGGRVTVHFEGPIATKQIKGRIVRCEVSAIGEKGALEYQTAVAFYGRLSLAVNDDKPFTTTVEEPDPPQAAESSASAEEPEDAPESLNRW
jgi:PilZ domain-containing protein